MSEEFRLEVNALTRRFDGNAAVDQISFSIQPGQVFCLLGPSGCGKSTLLRTIAGFYQPDIGELYFDDQLMNNVPPHKRNIGMVFQNYALWPHMTVYHKQVTNIVLAYILLNMTIMVCLMHLALVFLPIKRD